MLSLKKKTQLCSLWTSRPNQTSCIWISCSSAPNSTTSWLWAVPPWGCGDAWKAASSLARLRCLLVPRQGGAGFRRSQRRLGGQALALLSEGSPGRTTPHLWWRLKLFKPQLPHVYIVENNGMFLLHLCQWHLNFSLSEDNLINIVPLSWGPIHRGSLYIIIMLLRIHTKYLCGVDSVALSHWWDVYAKYVTHS